MHFGDQQIFPGATNYVCLLFLARAGVESCRFVRADALPIWLATQQGTEGLIPLSKVAHGPWNFVVGKDASLFEQLEAVELRLADATERIFQGLKTSSDKVYIVEEISRRGDAHTRVLKANGARAAQRDSALFDIHLLRGRQSRLLLGDHQSAHLVPLFVNQ